MTDRPMLPDHMSWDSDFDDHKKHVVTTPATAEEICRGVGVTKAQRATVLKTLRDLGLLPADDFEDDEDDDSDLDTEALPGSAPSTPELPSMASDLLLEIVPAIHRLKLLLSEADADEWKILGVRLKAFHAAVAEVPTKPPAARAIGFKVKEKPVRKAKAKKTRSTRKAK